jgi:hypothetical protein
MRRRHIKGTGTLAMLLILLLAASLMLLYANRALIFEQRSAANQWRATQAFEAAEAGRNWVIAQLNQRGEIDATCQPVAAAGTAAANNRFRQRYLSVDAATGRFSPAVAAAPGCAVTDNDWRCHCPVSGNASLSAAADTETPAFSLRLSAGPTPGSLRVDVTGCSHVGVGCGGSAPVDATAQVQFMLATLSALARPPAATLSSGGTLTLQSGVSVANTDPASGGTTVSTGGLLQLAPEVRLIGPAGSLGGADSAVSADAQFLDGSGALLPDERLFAQVFALSRSSYRDLPTVQVLSCQSGCSATEVDSAIASGARLIWIDGTLRLSSSPSWGTDVAPLLLIIDGSAQIDGQLQFTGLLHARSLSWNNPNAAVGTLRGAVVTTGSLQASGALQLVRDAEVLSRLAQAEGAFIPVPGSWRDFVE